MNILTKITAKLVLIIILANVLLNGLVECL